MATLYHYHHHHHHQPADLEQFLQSQEAAKSFDDDLDFCPSLSAEELSERLLESGSATSSPSPSRATASRAIAIVDPTSRAPVQIPGLSGSTIGSPASVAAMPSRHSSMSSVWGPNPGSDTSSMDFYLDAQDAFMLDWPFQQQQLLQMHQLHQPQQYFYNSMSSPPRLTSGVPIVDPMSGGVVDQHDPSAPAWQQQHFVSVR